MNTTRFVPPTKSYAGYVFDCDGTLADTMPLHFEAWRHALSDACFEFSWPLFTSRAGMSLENTVRALNDQFSMTLDPEGVANEQRRYYRSIEDRVQPISEVLDFARAMARHARVSVATGSNRPSVERTLTRIGAIDLFDIVVTPEDVVEGKPAPDMFLLAAERMAIPSASCLVLEDAEMGFEAARRAGMDYAVIASEPPPTA